MKFYKLKMNMNKFRFCRNKRVDALIKVLLLFVVLVVIVFSLLCIKNGALDFNKTLLRAIELIIKLCILLIVIDYIRIKSKRMK